ncbi:MAG: hypothetical protein AAF149_22230, partial [Bacteroidota bacterium]
SNGNVLIGKTSQSNTSYKLDVAGKVRANEIVVNTNGADYVFGEDYKHKSLDEVETFINENNHLPGIPFSRRNVGAGDVCRGVEYEAFGEDRGVNTPHDKSAKGN